MQEKAYEYMQHGCGSMSCKQTAYCAYLAPVVIKHFLYTFFACFEKVHSHTQMTCSSGERHQGVMLFVRRVEFGNLPTASRINWLSLS